MRYETCVFDFYGTLVDIRTHEDRPELWKTMADFFRARGADYGPEQLEKAYGETVRARERQCRPLRRDVHEGHPEIQILDVFRDLYREKGVAADRTLLEQTARTFRAASTEFLRLYPGADRLLRDLRAQGCRLFLLSNAQSVYTRWELKRLGLEAAFDGIYLSSDYGFKKPDRRFFEVLLHENALDPAGTVMIGNDGTCDIQGAKAMWLTTIYVHSEISPQEPLPQADFLVDPIDLEQVRRILLNP